MESVRGSPFFFFRGPCGPAASRFPVTPRGRGQAGLHRAGTVERRPVVSAVGGGGGGGGGGGMVKRKAPVYWEQKFHWKIYLFQ